jgi:sec-independent protein translocase protein TatB
VFGFSFGEILVISLVTLVAVGPQKLPGMLKTMGQWARKLRKMTMDVRQQTGIDEMLRAEGIQISELRTLMRGYHGGPFAAAAAPAPAPSPAPAPAPAPRYDDPYSGFEPDPTREYPPEGADAYGALPDDLLEPATSNAVADAPGPPDPKPEPAPVPEPAAEPIAVAEPIAAEPIVVAEPIAAEPIAVAEPIAAAAPAPAPAALIATAAPAPPVRSVPPPPPSSRAVNAVPRPAGTPPPPPRRTVPPRPDSSPLNKPEAPAAAPLPPRPGTSNGNG